MKEFLVGAALAPVSDDETAVLAALERELDCRIDGSAKIGSSGRTVKTIFQNAYLGAYGWRSIRLGEDRLVEEI